MVLNTETTREKKGDRLTCEGWSSLPKRDRRGRF